MGILGVLLFNTVIHKFTHEQININVQSLAIDQLFTTLAIIDCILGVWLFHSLFPYARPMNHAIIGDLPEF